MMDSVYYRSYYAWMVFFHMTPRTASYYTESLLEKEHVVDTPRDLWLEQEMEKSRYEAAYEAAVAACDYACSSYKRCNYRRTVA